MVLVFKCYMIGLSYIYGVVFKCYMIGLSYIYGGSL